MKSLFGVALREGEERCAVVRASGFSYLPRVAFGMAWVAAACVFAFPLLRLGMWGLVWIGFIGVSGMWYLFRLRRAWHGTALLFTTERCIALSPAPLGKNVITEVDWADVREVVARGRQLRVVLRKGIFDIALDGVANAEEMRGFANEVQYLHRRKGA